jgi:hypothetical protein
MDDDVRMSYETERYKNEMGRQKTITRYIVTGVVLVIAAFCGTCVGYERIDAQAAIAKTEVERLKAQTEQEKARTQMLQTEMVKEQFERATMFIPTPIGNP